MTLATKITLARFLLVPVYSVLVIAYSQGAVDGHPEEAYRFAALATFIIAAASDGLDGWVARKYNQYSKEGAFWDPFADKFLLITAVVFLSVFPWGPNGWQLPLWFSLLVILRDIVIIIGIAIIKKYAHNVVYQPHWTGKMCTVTQMTAIGWIMLKVVPFSPLYPCLVAALFTLWSGIGYIQNGYRQLTLGLRSVKPEGAPE